MDLSAAADAVGTAVGRAGHLSLPVELHRVGTPGADHQRGVAGDRIQVEGFRNRADLVGGIGRIRERIGIGHIPGFGPVLISPLSVSR